MAPIDAATEIVLAHARRNFEQIAADRIFAVARQARLGRAVELHDAFAVEQDDTEGKIVEFVLAKRLYPRREIGRVEIDGLGRHGKFPLHSFSREFFVISVVSVAYADTRCHELASANPVKD